MEPYASCAVGYWGDNTHFNPIIKVTSGGSPPIELNGGFSVIGKEGITADIRYVRPDMGSQHAPVSGMGSLLDDDTT